MPILHGKFSSLVDILSWLLDKFLSDLACINMEKVTKSLISGGIDWQSDIFRPVGEIIKGACHVIALQWNVQVLKIEDLPV